MLRGKDQVTTTSILKKYVAPYKEIIVYLRCVTEHKYTHTQTVRSETIICKPYKCLSGTGIKPVARCTAVDRSTTAPIVSSSSYKIILPSHLFNIDYITPKSFFRESDLSSRYRPTDIRLSQQPRVYHAKGPVTPTSHTNLSCYEILSENWDPPTDNGSMRRLVYQKMGKASPRVKLVGLLKADLWMNLLCCLKVSPTLYSG